MQLSQRKLNLDDLSPVLIRSARNVLRSGFDTGIRVIGHYQLQYIQDGSGTINVDGHSYAVGKGMLCFWGPGIQHRIVANTEKELVILGAQFHLVPEAVPVTFRDSPDFSPLYNVHAQSRVEALLLEIAREYAGQRLYWRETTSSLCRLLLLILARQTTMKVNNQGVAAVADRVIDFIQERYREPLTNETLAQQFHFHPSYLNKLVQAATGLSVHQLLIHIRINHAAEHLHTTTMTISEIAEAVGYSDLPYFSRLFKKKMGVSPSVFRSADSRR
ncbi:helix-turn-helix transcriptional regulator [Paenibacillus chungangensis]|uniref:Helix-turn-helix domain-containing protein n=1 Tax=Paenibacillus chungangensis TaxID=696535 RepID=A0ABW3HL24_9BACL